MAACKKYPHIPDTTISESYALGQYKSEGWDALNRRNKILVIRSRMQAPYACPLCDRIASLELYNKSGKYPDDTADYGFACHSCTGLMRNGKPPGASRRIIQAKRVRVAALLKEIEQKRPDLNLISHLEMLLPK